MNATHIRLELSGRNDATMLLMPIAGTVFQLTPDHQTLAITVDGRVYKVEDSLPAIMDALSVVRPVED